ncbi:ABC-type branched-subunit amino acid transport system ATPase component [Sulfitobacter undariae]|uniref:ABC-type branched-subunit amino acid transport system ATPase component n=1 Tax=Sulfitobacter undariae TaxID=1563671 RepID=A0A7W6E798_9RHOB|nr:ATP-binding cassette domain-containing protein [Sulfitobacter undariae]MBB3996040.1 ABC-type branched-subunit amino acid transport system ATPase component [Sulfitobacter undariae]
MAFFEIASLCAFYGKAQALHDVSLSVEKGEIIAIVGANGAGKSTLLDSVMGMTKTSGTVTFDGSVVTLLASGPTIFFLILEPDHAIGGLRNT